ncbi:unnamed protein product [Ceutorhynchus assimilis]|uniref:Uncharacterized protein n=1 Tax=Ceutorhynchus assimilis TaxID=467358 RepID=A0A9N9MEX0_9CUCU|nr:unnamed protein product [Ceutorhynchus assimilis]
MLSWISREEEAAYYAIQTGENIEDSHMENNPEKVSDVVLHPEVDFSLIRQFLQKAAGIFDKKRCSKRTLIDICNGRETKNDIAYGKFVRKASALKVVDAEENDFEVWPQGKEKAKYKVLSDLHMCPELSTS